MANQYVNKVQKSDGTTIIDITDTTATAADVSTGKYFYAVNGEKTEGLNAGGNAFTINDSTDSAGGTIRTVSAVDISNDTVTAGHLESGYTAHDANGLQVTGTLVPGITPTGTKSISITSNGTTTEDVTSYATASITTAVPASAVDSGTKSISISSNGTTTHDVVGYASASITAAVPNSYSASDEGKVVDNGALVSQTAHADVTPTTSDQTISTTTNNSIKVIGDADLVAGNIKKDVEIFGVTGSYEGGGGGADLSWLAANTPTPNVRNFFYALVNGTAEHGEFTLTTQSTSMSTILTLTNFSDANPPQGMMFIDKNFYRGESYDPSNSEAASFFWFDKAFINTASTQADGLKYAGVKSLSATTGTGIANNTTTGFVYLDGTTEIFRTKFYLDGHNFQIQNAYSNNNRYVLFRRDRTYIWIAY